MPAVRVEVGYLSHAGDAARLASPEFRDTVAEGIVAAVHRLYLTPELEELRSAGSAGLAAAG
jgi:N-acetylmuramoyl-L-alanine amidase